MVTEDEKVVTEVVSEEGLMVEKPKSNFDLALGSSVDMGKFTKYNVFSNIHR